MSIISGESKRKQEIYRWLESTHISRIFSWKTPSNLLEQDDWVADFEHPNSHSNPQPKKVREKASEIEGKRKRWNIFVFTHNPSILFHVYVESITVGNGKAQIEIEGRKHRAPQLGAVWYGLVGYIYSFLHFLLLSFFLFLFHLINTYKESKSINASAADREKNGEMDEWMDMDNWLDFLHTNTHREKRKLRLNMC